MNDEIRALEQQIAALTKQLNGLRQKQVEATEVPNYTFDTVLGSTDLKSLFCGKKVLFAIHNMGQCCRYCTLWSDGLNGFLPHLEDKFAVVLLSKDAPEIQQRFAHSRGWRFRLASHGGGAYLVEQSVTPGEINMPGLVCYLLEGDKIIRKNSTEFGPGDAFCGLWHMISLAGYGDDEGPGNWTPQYSYWQKPERARMEDGGQNLCCCD